jgi:uncharacterized UBP type Zn finger protein
MSAPECTHTEMIEAVEPSSTAGCSECLKTGDRWMHLRLCLSCGEVACCDSSPNQHASKHAAATGHPIAASFEPGEDWAWCYVDEVMLDAGPLGLPSHE